MATHDYVIANGTGAAVRSDLNGALAAIVSQNSSATEPSPSYAYQRWADTTAGVMKMRNGANNAWISLYELDGTFLAGDISLSAGAAATPSLFFTGDSNTGIYSPGADQVAISTGGVQRINIEADGDINIDGGGVFYDATNNRVGISTANPSNQLTVGSNGVSTITLDWTGDNLPKATFSANHGTGEVRMGATNNSGTYFTTLYSNNSEAVRIDSSGFVVAGGTSNNNSRIAANISGVLNGFASRTTAAAGTGYSHFSASVNISGALADVFYVYGNGNVQNTNNSYGALSDAKLKENIVDATSQWADVKAFRVRKYNFKEGQTHTQIGLVSQEVELVSPGLVTESPDRDAEGNELGTVTKSVNYSVLYMKAVKALQEAMERIETLEASNADMLARVTALEAA